MNKVPFLAVWKKVLTGKPPMLSIEITRECPLHCPGCYAYEPNHLGGPVTLRQLSDSRGDQLVDGIIQLAKQQRPLQISIVGGEPLVRHRELSRILPELSRMGIFTLVVTSAVIPIPLEWKSIPRVRIAVSVDGLQEDHDSRRHPATYDRILNNIKDHTVDVSWVITAQQMQRPGYLDEYLKFWTTRPGINNIWFSIYTPQIGERSDEMLTFEQRKELASMLPELKRKYPALLLIGGMEEAIMAPPSNPAECLFSKMSVNYTADLKTRIEPCFFGGTPDCSQCGCAVSTSLHWIGKKKLFGPLTANHVIRTSIAIGSFVNRLHPTELQGVRWSNTTPDEVS
jgi:MoaA/NifB/PqqE/SkfB family radical SAM enzyme